MPDSNSLLFKILLQKSKPLVSARADTPVSDCIRIMKRRNVGAIAIMNDGAEEKMVGIFTERDVVKCIDLIEEGQHWNKPVRTVMTKDPITIDEKYISQAHRVFAKADFRHLPVAKTGKDGKKHIVGMISVRDLFKILLKAKKD